MTKITADHLGRGAFVYVRQSTAMQVTHNLESQRRQYGLADRARQLGWEDVEVIDDDLGRSGGGIRRPCFERLLEITRMRISAHRLLNLQCKTILCRDAYPSARPPAIHARSLAGNAIISDPARPTRHVGWRL
jgi:Resolvase, N terminal domain